MIVVYNLHFGPRPFVGLLRCELMLMSIADLNYIYICVGWVENGRRNPLLTHFL